MMNNARDTTMNPKSWKKVLCTLLLTLLVGAVVSEAAWAGPRAGNRQPVFVVEDEVPPATTGGGESIITDEYDTTWVDTLLNSAKETIGRMARLFRVSSR